MKKEVVNGLLVVVRVCSHLLANIEMSCAQKDLREFVLGWVTVVGHWGFFNFFDEI
jgi:hypothetical protein